MILQFEGLLKFNDREIVFEVTLNVVVGVSVQNARVSHLVAPGVGMRVLAGLDRDCGQNADDVFLKSRLPRKAMSGRDDVKRIDDGAAAIVIELADVADAVDLVTD